MGERIDVNYCENAEEVLASDVLWEIGIRIVKQMNKYSITYYSDIIEKVKNKKGLNEQEYADILELLNLDEFIAKAKRFYSKTNMNIKLDLLQESASTDKNQISHLKFENILSSVNEQLEDSLIKNLNTTFALGEIYSVGLQEYLCVNIDGEKNLCGIISEIETLKGKIFIVENINQMQGVVSETTEIIVPLGEFLTVNYSKQLEIDLEYFSVSKDGENGALVQGIYNLEGEQLFGGCKWDATYDIVMIDEGKIFLEVEKDEKIGLVQEDGYELFGGCKWAEVLEPLNNDSFVGPIWNMKNKDGKIGLIQKNGKEVFGGCKWDAPVNKLLKEGDQIYAVVNDGRGKEGLVDYYGNLIFGGCKREGIVGFRESPDGNIYLEVIQEKQYSSFIKDGRGLVSFSGDLSYGEKWTAIKGFIIAPNGMIYLWVYNHADAYMLEGLVDEDGKDVFGGCEWHLEEINFYKDNNGEIYLEVQKGANKTKYISIDGFKKSWWKKIEKIED